MAETEKACAPNKTPEPTSTEMTATFPRFSPISLLWFVMLQDNSHKTCKKIGHRILGELVKKTRKINQSKKLSGGELRLTAGHHTLCGFLFCSFSATCSVIRCWEKWWKKTPGKWKQGVVGGGSCDFLRATTLCVVSCFALPVQQIQSSSIAFLLPDRDLWLASLG